MSDYIYFGDAVKAVDDAGKVGGYLVLFTDAKNKDLDGEYFTKFTYYGARNGDGVDTVFHHGRKLPLRKKLPADQKARIEALSDHIFSTPVKTRVEDVGIWAETVLDLADEYEAAVYSLVQAGKMSWSSGAVSHLVRKEADGKITRWPIGEASLTPTPARPFSKVAEVKSLDGLKLASPLFDEVAEDGEPIPDRPTGLAGKLRRHLEDLADDGRTREAIAAQMAAEAGLPAEKLAQMLAGDARPSNANLKAFARVLGVTFDSLKAYADRDHAQTIKGMFEEALAERQFSRWELESVYADVVAKLAMAAAGAKRAGVPFNVTDKIREATQEYATRLLNHALDQTAKYVEEGENEPFYLKSILTAEDDLHGLSSADLDDHSSVVVSAVRGICARFRGNHASRVKSGRVLSEKNRTRITALLDQLKAVGDDLQKLLDESKPMATETEKRAAQSEFLRLQARTKQLGV